MPYAAFHGDGQVINSPTLAELRALADTTPPAGLMIFKYQFESIEPLSIFPKLQVLKIQDCGGLTSLKGLEALPELKALVISPPSSWEKLPRTINVDSLAPIATLKNLEKLTLLRVKPADLDLSPLAGMKHLLDIHLAGVPQFKLKDYARLSVALPNTDGRCLRPYHSVEGMGPCKKCGTKIVFLTGTAFGARGWLCPVCNKKKLDAHVAAWEAAKIAVDVADSTQDERIE